MVENARTTSFLYAFLGCGSTFLIGFLAGILGIVGGAFTFLPGFIFLIRGLPLSFIVIGISIFIFSLFICLWERYYLSLVGYSHRRHNLFSDRSYRCVFHKFARKYHTAYRITSIQVCQLGCAEYQAAHRCLCSILM